MIFANYMQMYACLNICQTTLEWSNATCRPMSVPGICTWDIKPDVKGSETDSSSIKSQILTSVDWKLGALTRGLGKSRQCVGSDSKHTIATCPHTLCSGSHKKFCKLVTSNRHQTCPTHIPCAFLVRIKAHSWAWVWITTMPAQVGQQTQGMEQCIY